MVRCAWILFLLPSFVHAADVVCARTATTLRKAPSVSAAISWKVPRYMPFLRSERKNGFSKVEDLEGESHWVKSGDLTNKIRCVAIKTNIATLRREPASGASPSDLRTVDKYTPFKRLENEREWMQIEDETGRQAWVHESQVWKPAIVNSFSF